MNRFSDGFRKPKIVFFLPFNSSKDRYTLRKREKGYKAVTGTVHFKRDSNMYHLCTNMYTFDTNIYSLGTKVYL